MSLVSALAYFGIGARDVDAWERYASEVLGMGTTRTVVSGAETIYLRVDERKYRVAVQSGDDEVTHVGWEVETPEGLDTLKAALSAAGIDFVEDADLASVRGVRRLVSCKDPGGLTQEFVVGATVPQQNFVSPTGASFVTKDPAGGEMGIGHVVFATPDFEASMVFYRDILGFKISDYIVLEEYGIVLTFLHINSRHHSLAIVQGPPDTKQFLDHFSLEVEDIDTVGRALDKVHDEKISVTATLGRHTNDEMLSFYIKTPSGFGVEYGTGGKLVDQDNWTVVAYDKAEFWGHERENVAPPPDLELIEQEVEFARESAL